MTTPEIGASALRPIDEPIIRGVTARLVREYIRSEMIEGVIQRLYSIGMGIEKFSVPTMSGTVVSVEASASVQIKALLGLVATGVPAQVGLVDDDGNALPGVVALGELELAAAQQQVNGGRMAGAARVFGAETIEGNGNGSAPIARPMQDRIDAGEFSLVEVEEGIGTNLRNLADVAPPPLDTSTPTPEQQALARIRARRKKNGG